MIDNTKEYIIASAVHYDDKVRYSSQDVYGVASGIVIGGFRHANAMEAAPCNPHYDEDPDSFLIRRTREYETIQGFITSYGRFVDRKEAAKLAVDCGQVDPSIIRGGNLYSEEVFPYQINTYKND